jgi:hypothetical protein
VPAAGRSPADFSPSAGPRVVPAGRPWEFHAPAWESIREDGEAGASRGGARHRREELQDGCAAAPTSSVCLQQDAPSPPTSAPPCTVWPPLPRPAPPCDSLCSGSLSAGSCNTLILLKIWLYKKIARNHSIA